MRAPYRVTGLLSALLVPLLLAAWPGGGARGEEAPVPPRPEAIDGAIERGVGFLLEEAAPSGAWGTGSQRLGHTALGVFTLLHAGASETGDTKADRALRRALKLLDGEGPGHPADRSRTQETYTVSLLLLVLRDRGREEDRGRMQRLVRILEEGQAANGQWTYACGGGGTRAGAGDNSNTQFAVLALGAAVGEGLEVGTEVLERARAWWLVSAQRDGGFGYASGGSLASASTGSMTAAGVAALGILEAALGGRAPPPSGAPPPAEVLRGATRRLAADFSVRRNFGPAQGGVGQRQRNAGRGWLHYHLWSVERAMVLAGTERLGAHDWYAEGAHHLLATQKRDGSWRQEHPLYATCFALLFLTRAADPPRAFTPRARVGPVTPRSEEGPQEAPGAAPPAPGAAPEAPEGPGGGGEAGREDVGDRVAAWLREDLPPGVLPQRCLAAGPGSLLPLVRALDDPDREVRRRAGEGLRLLLGEERFGRADRHPLPRGRLGLWVRRNARHLVAQDGRFVEVGR